MSFPGTVLASGVGSAGLTLDVDVPGDGQIQVVFVSTSLGGDGGTGRHPSAASDPSGSPWTTTTSSKPLIGLAEMDIGSGTIDSLMVGSIGRDCVAGDMEAGDAISVTWASTGSGTFQVEYVTLYLPSNFVIVEQGGGGASYNNGLGWPFAASTPHFLSWPDDSFEQPNPDEVAFMLAAFASWAQPAAANHSSPAVPFEGYVIAEVNGVAYLTVTGADDLPAGVDYDPGVTFTDAPSYLDPTEAAYWVTVANYQMMSTPTPPPSAGGIYTSPRTIG